MNLQSIKKILKKIFFLPPIPTLLISIPAYGLVIYALAGESVNPVITYAAYLLSAYAFIITVTGMIGVVRWGRKEIGQNPFVKKMLSMPFVGRYLREDRFRAETAMLTQFGSANDADFRQIMTASTGAGVSVIVLGMAVYMIVYATRRLKIENRRGETIYDSYTGSGG